MQDEAIIALEKEVEDVLYELMELEVEEEIIRMNEVFGRLLASVQSAGLIDSQLNVLVDLEQCPTEIRCLLESLKDVKEAKYRKKRLMTHRQIIKIWLRKNQHFKLNFLPSMF